jgi:ABC-type multidrug transport system fused ATPase/permease subunit
MTPSFKSYGDLLRTYLRPQWPRVLALALLLAGSITLQLVGPQILRYFIDAVRSGATLQSLTAIGIGYLSLAVMTQVMSVAETYVAENVGWTAANRLRADLALHCLLLDPAFHNAHTPGDLIERVDGDVATLGNFFSRFVVYVLGNVLLLAGVLALLFRIHWQVGAAMAAFVVAGLVFVNRMRNVAVPYWAAARQASADVFGYLEERMGGVEDIRSSGATANAMRGFYAVSRDHLRKERRAAFMGVIASQTWVFLALGTAISLTVAGRLYQAGAITIGTAYLIFNYSEMLGRPIDQLMRQIQDLQQAGASIGRIQNIFNTQSAIHDGFGGRLHEGALPVNVQSVSFGYDNEEPILKDLDFSLPAGKALGVLGRTGSGKTTLARLLFRLYDPTCGAIRLGGVDPRDVPVEELRARVGIVTQDIQLFHATLRDNLTFFDRGVSDERLWETLEELGLDAWCRALPQGLDTKLAPGGGGVSAGEAQLLAFARVFLKDPGLVILDEASSRLDPATERRLEQAVDRLLRGRTGIVIAHRLQTVERVDTILILDQGRIAEFGPREELANDPRSRFARLLKTGLEEALA